MKTTIDINKLKTIKHYAGLFNYTTAGIYKRIKEGKMKAVIIDEVKFIDMSEYPTLESK